MLSMKVYKILTCQNLVSGQLHDQVDDFLFIIEPISFLNIRATNLGLCNEHL